MSYKNINWMRVFFGEKEERKKKFWKSVRSNLIELGIAILLFGALMGGRCAIQNGYLDEEAISKDIEAFLSETSSTDSETSQSETATSGTTTAENSEMASSTVSYYVLACEEIDFDNIADDCLCIELNNGVPYFTDDEITMEQYEKYSDLDNLGRCGVAEACLCQAMMPPFDAERGDISEVKPSGWKSIQADDIDKGWLYNRSHLIAWALTGQDANPKNLVTGTRQFNNDAMLPQEIAVEEVLDKNPGLHIMYRVTPVFIGDELVCRGVIMEAFSVEDNGVSIQYCFFIPNVQQGWVINYADGTATRKE